MSLIEIEIIKKSYHPYRRWVERVIINTNDISFAEPHHDPEHGNCSYLWLRSGKDMIALGPPQQFLEEE